jgi:glucosamine 6-phosphate synthetase-like amidotransferase/phosphosugar isomerase protein
MKNETLDDAKYEINWLVEDVYCGKYEHLMLKKIYKQTMFIENYMIWRFFDNLIIANFG